MTESAGGAADRGTLRSFGLGLGIILGGLAALQAWRHHPAAAGVLAGAAAAALAAAAASPPMLRPVHSLFSRLGHALGWVNTRVLLAIIFFVIITPMALVMRLVRRDPLSRAFEAEVPSYWIPRGEETRGRERYEQMY